MTFALRTLTLAALAALSFGASAMTAIDDEALSTVSGQDGVTIAGDLNINIGSFQYTDTGSTGGSVSFNNIGVRGLFVMQIDILKGVSEADVAGFKTGDAAATAAVLASAGTSGTAVNSMAVSIGTRLAQQGVTTTTTNAELGKFVMGGLYNGGDVVQFAFPNAGLDHSLSPTVTVGSIKMGGSSASFGSLAINNIDMQGSKFAIWAH
jgi:hypothetical protein